MNRLNDMFGDDDATSTEFLASFLAPSQEIIAGVIQARDGYNAIATSKAVAKVKSRSRIVGANASADTCAAPEKADKSGNEDEINTQAPLAQGQFNAVASYIRSLSS